MHNIFNFPDTEVIACVLLVLWKRVDGLRLHLNVR